VGCLSGDWVGGGTRSRCFNSGYHDLGLLQVDFFWLFMYACQVGYYSYAKGMLQLVSLVKYTLKYLKIILMTPLKIRISEFYFVFLP